jgi:hypothetical protein
MKVRLLQIITENNSINFGNDDYHDYDDIAKYCTSEVSPWEEVDNDTIYDLRKFIKDQNREYIKNGYFYILITENQPTTCQMLIKEMVDKQLQKKKEYEARQLIFEQKVEAAKKLRAAKKLQNAQKRLEKLQREIELAKNHD